MARRASPIMVPRKRKIGELDTLLEPPFSEAQDAEFSRGIHLFNQQAYWKAHEAWENVWQDMSDNQEDDAEIILRGLIQLTAGLHLLSVGKLEGAVGNLYKSKEKLALYDRRFMGVDLNALVSNIQSSVNSPQKLSGYQILRAEKKEN